MRPTPIAVALSFALAASSANAQYLRTIEAEHCEHVGGTAIRDDSIWYSAQGAVADFWGEKAGDRIRFRQTVLAHTTGMRIAVRYSFSEAEYKGFRGIDQAGDGIVLRIDGGAPIPLSMPDTGDWLRFDSAIVPIPHLALGDHTFEIESTVPFSARNIDCFTFFPTGRRNLPAPLRASIVARSADGRWEIQTTPDAPLVLASDELFAQLDRIWTTHEAFIGWAPPTPVRVHLVSQRLWDNPGATAYQNQWGVFFRAEAIATEQGNMAHELTHQFYVARFPGWFDESSVRALTTLVWMPRIFGAPSDDADAWLRDGRSLLADPTAPIDTPERLWATLAAKYGPDVFSRFFHACRDAGASGELDFAPGRHLTKSEIVAMMNRAAAEDTAGLFGRWVGFAEAP